MPEKIYLSGKHRTRNTKPCTIPDSLDPALSSHIMDVSVHTIDIPRIITAKAIIETGFHRILSQTLLGLHLLDTP